MGDYQQFQNKFYQCNQDQLKLDQILNDVGISNNVKFIDTLFPYKKFAKLPDEGIKHL